jgi:hypothetical protein
MNLNNVARKVAFHIDNDIWANVENLVDKRVRVYDSATMEVSYNIDMGKVDSIFKNVSVSVVDTVLPKWFFQFYRLH